MNSGLPMNLAGLTPYAEWKQRELNEKGEKTGKLLCTHVISLHSSGIPQKLQQDIKDNPIIDIK